MTPIIDRSCIQLLELRIEATLVAERLTRRQELTGSGQASISISSCATHCTGICGSA